MSWDTAIKNLDKMLAKRDEVFWPIDSVRVERVNISSDLHHPVFLLPRESKDVRAPRSPRKSFRKSSKR